MIGYPSLLRLAYPTLPSPPLRYVTPPRLRSLGKGLNCVYVRSTGIYCSATKFQRARLCNMNAKDCSQRLQFMKNMYVYRPPMKLREGNVFMRVCLSTGGVPYDHYPWYIGLQYTGPPAPPSTHGTLPTWEILLQPPASYQWHLVANTTDQFKLVQFRAPPPVLTLAVTEGSVQPFIVRPLMLLHFSVTLGFSGMKVKIGSNWKQESTILRVS